MRPIPVDWARKTVRHAEMKLFFDDMGDRYRFVTGRPANAKEKRLYREWTRGR